MRPRSVLVILGLVGVLAALAMGSTALAQTPTPAPKQQKQDYRELFLDRLAENLKVDRQRLNDALTQAGNDAIDQAVKEGRLTQQQADRMKQRQGPTPWPLPFRGLQPRKLPNMSPGIFPGGTELRNAIAEALGMTPEELATQLRSGKTLKALAQEKGREKEVKDAILEQSKQRLDQAVANGRLTQQQADKIYERLQGSDLPAFSARGWSPGPNGRQEMKPLRPGVGPSLGPAHSTSGAL